MTDAALAWKDTGIAIVLDGALLRTDNGLQNAVIISLFTDCRASDDDVIPDGSNNRRGFYINPTMGSRLWLLSREKNLPDVLNRTHQYAREALQWLIDDGIVDVVEVSVESLNRDTLAISVQIHHPRGNRDEYRFQYLWGESAVFHPVIH